VTASPDGGLFGVGYGPILARPRRTRLYRADADLKFQIWSSPFTPALESGETTIRFLGNKKAVAIVRQDGTERNARIGISEGDYRQWQFSKAGERIGGPDLLELPNGRLLGAGRLYNPVRMALFAVRPGHPIEEVLKLPSGGDCGYPGVVWHDDLLWVSYYSSHEGKAAIYVARVRLALGDE
jgi:hypothetical protein